MLRRLVTLGALVGGGWYLYRKLKGGDQSAPESATRGQTGDDETGVTGRVSQSVSQAADAARRMVAKARETVPMGRETGAAEPTREARSAWMAGLPAVQEPASFPEGAMNTPPAPPASR